MVPQVDYLEVGGRPIAFRLRDGGAPTLVFLPGYASDMAGSKALALDAFAEGRGLGMLRFDYSGTGASAGSFEDSTLELWLGEAIALIDRLTQGPVILVGSSMGGWIALRIALVRRERVQALVGIAVAPDFTDWGFTSEEKAQLLGCGRLEQSNPYGPQPQLFTLSFWESAQRLLLLNGPIEADCPVRLFHGDQDEEVPIEVALRTMTALRSADVQLSIIKGGGHRLSRSHEIDAILRSLAALLELAP